MKPSITTKNWSRMSRVITKYLVADETGPLRSFYDPNEALRFAQPGWTITEVREARYEPKKPTYDEAIAKCGESLF
jgi:hypothetical protein